jgi:hypothetical protein
MRVCSQPGCPTLVPKAGRCAQHRQEYERKRGTRTERGYGSPHVRLRANWKLKVEAGGVLCWRCGEPILPGTPWDLGHDDSDRTRYKGPEHANRCNRSAAGRAAH